MMETIKPQSPGTCWICGRESLELARPRTVPSVATPDLFRITDASYGQTFTIHRCTSCGFLQCMDAEDVLANYVQMSDDLYEATSESRLLQMRALLDVIGKFKPSGKLLDIGAGIGLLVEEARKRGFDAQGIEPSRALQKAAEARGIPVRLGVVPSDAVSGPFDIVTVVDVIEHVDNPVRLLETARSLCAKDGIGVLVTPDVQSTTARLMGWKWWHFRPAHIGYFDRSTLKLALERAGLRAVMVSRPIWYLPADYLAKRVLSYVPGGAAVRIPKFLKRITVPINLQDSLLVVFARRDNSTAAFSD